MLFAALQYFKKNLKLKGLIKHQLILRTSNFKKNISSGLKIICLFVKVNQNVYKTFFLAMS